MSKWKHRPKGQQPVSKDYKHKDNSIKREKYLKERREYRYKAKETVYGHKIHTPKYLWEFITGDLRYKDTYNNVLTQAERNLAKMYPCGGSWSIGGHSYSPNDWISAQSNCFIMEKRDKCRHSYFNEKEWKDMIDFIRDATLRRGAGIYYIILCKRKLTDEIWEANNKEYIEKYNTPEFNRKRFDSVFFDGFNREQLERMYFPKLYEKEKQFIINAGCTFEDNVEFNIIRKPMYNGDKEKVFVMEGWKFKIIMNEIPYRQEDNYIIKKGKKRNFIQRIKNILK
jgi:hypothetical protein